MAQLKDLIVSGSSRLLGTLYCNNLNVNGGATFNGTTSFNGALTAKGNVSAISTGSSSDDGYLITTSHGRTMKIGAQNSYWIHMCSGGTPIILDAGFFTTSSTGDLGSTSYRWSTLYCKGINNSGNITAAGTLNITGKSTLGETVASTLKTATINTESINVSDTLRSSKWEIETISNMGGSLYVAPTLQIANGSTCVVQRTNSTTFTLTIIDSANITADNLGGHVWSSGSKVKLSGTIGEVVLGTCNAILSAKMNATSGRLSLTVTSDQATLFSTTSTNLTCNNLNVMLYQVANGTNMYPVGIYMTSYGVNKYSYIDIYNGAQTGITTRIGKLDGAPAVNNTSPTGYGIYTNNGYFDGVIVSQSGKIGGFTLGASSISNGKTSYSETTNNGVWLGTDGIGLGKGTFYVTNAGALTATSGTIGGWGLNANYLYSQNTGTSPTAAGGTTRYWVALNKYSSASTKAFEVWESEWPAGASAKTDSYPFYVRYDGYMFASKGQIANWTLDTNSLQTGTWGTDNSAMLCTGTSSSKSIGGSSSMNGWVFTAGANFGVTKTGALYASSATISGAITATSLTISDAAKTAAGIASSSEIDNKINAIQIGGRNLICNTGNLLEWWHNVNYVSDESFDGSVINFTRQTAQSWNPHVCSYPVLSYDLIKGRKLTISCKCKSNKESTTGYVTFILCRTNSEAKDNTRGKYTSILSINASDMQTEWTEYTRTTSAVVDDAFFPSGTAYTDNDGYFKLYVYNYTLSTVSISDIKIEVGDKATMWSPAPEDFDIKSENIYNELTSENEMLSENLASLVSRTTELESNKADISRVDDVERLFDQNSLINLGYATIVDGLLSLQKLNSEYKLELDSNGLRLCKGNTTVAYIVADDTIGSALKVTNSVQSTIKLRTVDGVGSMGIIANSVGSHGHVTLKEV